MLDEPRTIRLYGKLGARFGRVHRFVCNDAAGAVRALCIMVPGFQEFLNRNNDSTGYAILAGGQHLTEDALHFPVGADEIRIAPVLRGAGRGGIFQIVLGVVLVAAAFFTGGASLTASGFVFSGAGALAVSVGVGLVIGGIAQMMVKTPEGTPGVDSADNGLSHNFNGPANTTAQGNVAPVHYGELIIGSATVSADLYSEDQL